MQIHICLRVFAEEEYLPSQGTVRLLKALLKLTIKEPCSADGLLIDSDLFGFDKDTVVRYLSIFISEKLNLELLKNPHSLI